MKKVFVCLRVNKGILSTTQHTDSHPCTRPVFHFPTAENLDVQNSLPIISRLSETFKHIFGAQDHPCCPSSSNATIQTDPQKRESNETKHMYHFKTKPNQN